jgi:hypothetical protein
MKIYFPAFAALALSFTSATLVPTLRADEHNKKTKIVIDQPIQVQDAILAPGSYVIKQLDSAFVYNTVQSFSAGENRRLITTVFAIPAYRRTPLDNSKFEFYESAAGQAASLHTWLSPEKLNRRFFPTDSFPLTLSRPPHRPSVPRAFF